MKRIGIILQLLLIAVLSGCWSSSELKDISIVAGVGIDLKGKNQFEVTTQTVKPAEVKKNKPGAVAVQSSTGFTVFEAVRDLIIKTGKKQNWQHISAYVISEEAAKTGVMQRIDFIARDHEPRFRMNLLVSKGKAKDILNIKSKKNPIPSAAMKATLEEQISLAKAPQVELHDFIEKLMEPYQDPYLPIIRKEKEDFEIYGTAVFKGDRMIGELTPRETRGMLRVLGEVKGGLQVVKFASEHKAKTNYLSIEIKKSKASIHAKITKNNLQMIIEIKETGFVGDMTQPVKELNNKKIKEMEQAYADTIKKEVEHTVSKIQKELKSSVFDFAGVINRKDKKFWKEHQQEWETLYPSLDVIVRVKTRIVRNGLIVNNPGK
ncbi:MAG: Ger(x)C family spore germination protein [Paenibacillaceae bacterium]